MESFLATLKEQVKCSLCNETLKEPKLLSCFHVFCTTCIKGHLQLNDEQENIFHCPECNSETRLRQDVNEVEELQVSPVHSRIVKVLEFIESQKICSVSSSHPEALFQCLDCDRSLCEECLQNHSEFTKNHRVVSLSDLKEEDIKVMLKKERPCKVHDDHIVESHCQDCDMLICVLCTKENHRKHNLTSVEEFIDVEKESLSKMIKGIDYIHKNEFEKERQDKIVIDIKDEIEKAEQQIRELTEKLIKTIKNNEQQLLNKIRKVTTRNERNLHVTRHSAQAQEYIKHFMENGTASEMIEIRQGEHAQNFTYDPFTCSRFSRKIEFQTNKELCEQVEYGLGQVQTYLKNADPKMSSVRVEPSEIQARGKAQLIIKLKTSRREDADHESLKDVKVIFTPKNDVEEGDMKMTDDGMISVDFTPRVSGPLSASVLLYGNSITNCPLVMLVKPQKMNTQDHSSVIVNTRKGFQLIDCSKLVRALNSRGRFQGIAVNTKKSKIAVADSQSNCIRVFDMKGNLLLNISDKEEQLRPVGMAFLNETDLVVVDKGNNRICILNTTTGKQIKTFGSRGRANGQFLNPSGVHVDKDKDITVCDESNNRVQVFSKDGDYRNQFEVSWPVSVVKHNELYYVSSNKSVIEVIKITDDHSPVKLATFDMENYTNSQHQPARCLAIDNDSNLLVCGGYPCIIHKFSLDGRYVGQSSHLDCITAIAVMDDKQAICTTERRVFMFEYN